MDRREERKIKMKTVITNQILVIDPTPELKAWILREMVITNPKYETLLRLGKEQQIIRYHISKNMALYAQRGNSYALPFGVLPAIWKYVKDYPYELRLNENGHISCLNDKITLPLYDYQETAVRKIMANKGGILIGGCGAGKTNCGVELAHRIGKPFLWLTHTADLVKQSYKRFKSLYPNMDIGITTDGKVEFGRDGTIATIQTMEKINPALYVNAFDVVITDECHHVSGSPTLMKMFGKVIEAIPARWKIGLSATKKRNDTLTKSMYSIVGCNALGEFAPTAMISKEETNTLEAKLERVDLDTPFSYSMLNEDGSFNYGALIDYISTNEQRNTRIAEKIASIDKESGRKQLVLCNRIDQCEWIYKKLLELGIKAVLLVGKVTAKKRQEILGRQVDWSVIVASNSLAKEGLDIVELSVLHWAGCIGNQSDTIQSAGRIERVMEGKPEPIIYDYVDTKIPYLVSRHKKRAAWLRNRE